MKRPTHVLANYDNQYAIATLTKNPFCKWIIKQGFDYIAIPDINIELPSFWGELRRYAFTTFVEIIQQNFTNQLDSILCANTVTCHQTCIQITTLSAEDFTEDDLFIYSFAKLELKELLAFIKLVKPEAKKDIEKFNEHIKHHFRWRRQMSSKDVCMFDNQRDNEDEEIYFE